jgi:hypothetical protein
VARLEKIGTCDLPSKVPRGAGSKLGACSIPRYAEPLSKRLTNTKYPELKTKSAVISRGVSASPRAITERKKVGANHER